MSGPKTVVNGKALVYQASGKDSSSIFGVQDGPPLTPSPVYSGSSNPINSNYGPTPQTDRVFTPAPGIQANDTQIFNNGSYYGI